MEKKNEHVTHGDGFADVVLRKAANVDGTAASTLRMREPTVGDTLLMDGFGGSDGEKEVKLFAHLCGVPPETIKGLMRGDYGRLQSAFMGFPT